MAKRDEINERALLAASLRRKKMAITNIALYLGVSERQV
jgi:predicted transcriptional regulator